MPTKLIDLQNISKFYQNSHELTYVLNELSLQIHKGEMVSIVGPSGSGKSTLMNIIGLMDTPSNGRYLLDNEETTGLTDIHLARIRNKKIGFVFQSFFLLARLTVLQNVMLPLFYQENFQDDAKEKALSLLEKVEMEKFINHKPNQLSGGQQQRVAIARALICDPEIILADEPTGALDSKIGTSIMNLLHNLNTIEKRTIIIITHDKQIAEQCKRIISIKDGIVI